MKGIPFGEHETGCFTQAGNEMALYVQTTSDLHQRRERIFAEVREAKRRWQKRGHATEFNFLLRLDKPGRELLKEAHERYRREFRIDKGNGQMGVCLGDTAAVGLDSSVDGRQDFVWWLAREFECYCIDMDCEERLKEAAA